MRMADFSGLAVEPAEVARSFVGKPIKSICFLSPMQLKSHRPPPPPRNLSCRARQFCLYVRLWFLAADGGRA
ncbi:hypothetical protein Hanom_Chr00s000004g01608611 [Helianthus anomalus]